MSDSWTDLHGHSVIINVANQWALIYEDYTVIVPPYWRYFHHLFVTSISVGYNRRFSTNISLYLRNGAR